MKLGEGIKCELFISIKQYLFTASLSQLINSTTIPLLTGNFHLPILGHTKQPSQNVMFQFKPLVVFQNNYYFAINKKCIP